MKIINKILQASTKQWALGNLFAGIILGIITFVLVIIKFGRPINFSLPIAIISSLVIFLPFCLTSIILFTIHLFTKNKSKLWAPFQSDQIKLIIEHMTKDEEKQIKQFSAISGIIVAVFFAIPLSFGLTWAYKNNSPVAIVLIIVWVLIGIPILLLRRRKAKELLCATKWAKEQGYKPELLKLNKFKS